jgi:glutamyl-tRNA synthetase
VGGARTALFNWLFARHHRGVYVLRIEDTDRSRSTEEYTQSLLEALRWLELDWDEGPPTPGYRQTERFDIYRAHAERLLAEGRAYRCRCTPETLEALRKTAEARKETFRYPGTCRGADVPASEPHALRLAIPREGETVVEDVVRGRVVFSHGELDDWILVRTDGTPTYNFCVVVDDVTMKITHVIRGNDHLSNTPKQVLCYQALGYPLPVFAHIPMILAPDKTRLSKRHGATSVLAFRDLGIVPEAMLNYLARLGWSHGDQEIFSRDEIAELFALEEVGRSAAQVDEAKLGWLNQHWLKALPRERLLEAAAPFLAEVAGGPVAPTPELGLLLDLLRERSRTLRELAERARFALVETLSFDEAAVRKHLTAESAGPLAALRDRLASLDEWSEPAIEREFETVRAAQGGLPLGKLAQPVRVAVTGSAA